MFGIFGALRMILFDLWGRIKAMGFVYKCARKREREMHDYEIRLSVDSRHSVCLGHVGHNHTSHTVLKTDRLV